MYALIDYLYELSQLVELLRIKASAGMITFRKADKNDIALIRELTFKIWPQTYSLILTPVQIEYMLNMMYSNTSLKEQIEEKQHTFIVVYYKNEAVGFASYSPKEALTNKVYRLHKIYISPAIQGAGLGKKTIEYIINDILPLGVKFLELNVNRHNKARTFYEKLGFLVVKEEDNAIGEGFFMNDYVMEKAL